jgi:Leucine-rich repeat (LRR) protein
LKCEYNKITELPKLNKKLWRLYCGYNQITKLPETNECLETMILDGNPVYNILSEPKVTTRYKAPTHNAVLFYDV